jgi:dinuclear metal center YbgI/SA1388 family protein
MRIERIAEVLDGIAPRRLALDWDNVGLLVGGGGDVKNVMLCIDVTWAVVDEAVRRGVDLIVSYHPVIWEGLKRVTAEGEGRKVYELLKAGVSVYSLHTGYDLAEGGVNDQLAKVVGIECGEPIGDFVDGVGERQYKVVTFVPVDNVNDVADAMADAGAGAIGAYRKCSFRSEGVGTFLPVDGARPAVGEVGRVEKVREVRLETVASAGVVRGVIEAMRSAHPYEEPAFDVLGHCDFEGVYGLGRIGRLEIAMGLEEVLARVKKATGAKAAGIVAGRKSGGGKFRTAAVCAGSCGKIINTVIAKGCELYVTGELKHHQALAAGESGVTCVCLSHSVSERFALKIIANRLKKELKDVTITLSRKDRDPFEWRQI